jgi:hypothetical protein
VTANASQTIAKAAKPITDATGRIRYIVDIIDDEVGKPDKFNDADSKIKYHKDKSDKLIADVAKIRGVEIIATTSLVGISFVAYLDAKQVDQLAKDKRVSLLTQDTYLKPSALWNNMNDNFGYPPQVRPWGLQAMGLTYAGSSNGTATVYVLDTGVELHADLPGLTAANQLTSVATDVNGQPTKPIGCYAHATHVAGIVGASSDNYVGVVGALPGVKIVSMAVGNINYGSCSDSYPVSGFTLGLDRIYQLVLQSGKPGIVNISYARDPAEPSNDFASTGTIGIKMRSVATPTSFYVGSYKGALVVQSAGNYRLDACGYAYNAPSASDGIMVVGGLDENGQPVAPINDHYGFVNGLSSEPGSNYGSCVDVWAPSQRVLSTWSSGTYKVLSGTSMAAPYVAGFAARLLQNDASITNSWQLESAVRAKLSTLTGSNLKMPELVGTSPAAIPTIEVIEGANSSVSSPISFNKFPSDINLKFGTVGADSCTIYLTQNGSYWSYQAPPPPQSFNLNAHLLPAGAAYVWTITCTSPAGATNTFVINGYIKQRVTVTWEASTSSTGNIWQVINSGDMIFWRNGVFNQRYRSTGATSCQVMSSGFRGNYLNDSSHPQYPYSGYGMTPLFMGTLLWNSQPGFPVSYTFAPFTYGNPVTAAPPLGSYEGYKWLLTCRNSDDVQSTVMYGKQKAPYDP